MRYLITLVLVAAPLAGQAHPIAPAPSRLFHSAPIVPVGSPGTVNGGMSQQTGGILGFVAGAGLGFTAVAMTQGGCRAEDAGGGGGMWSICGSSSRLMPRVLGAIVGGLSGVVIGSLLAGPDTPAGQ